MSRLDDITPEELQELREQTEGEIPRERVLAAIGRKQGDELETLAERHGVVEKTIRNWLDRFAREPTEQAPYDDDRPGRPSKLDEEQREQFFEQLQQPPTELGYDQQAWSPGLLLHHVKEEYGVEYSEGHARKLLSKAELSCRTARPRNHEADPAKKAEFQEQSKKTAGVDRDNRRCRRSVSQARRHCSTTWLVPNWLKSDDRDIELVA
jgi:transposase